MSSVSSPCNCSWRTGISQQSSNCIMEEKIFSQLPRGPFPSSFRGFFCLGSTRLSHFCLCLILNAVIQGLVILIYISEQTLCFCNQFFAQGKEVPGSSEGRWQRVVGEVVSPPLGMEDSLTLVFCYCLEWQQKKKKGGVAIRFYHRISSKASHHVWSFPWK